MKPTRRHTSEPLQGARPDGDARPAPWSPAMGRGTAGPALPRLEHESTAISTTSALWFLFPHAHSRAGASHQAAAQTSSLVGSLALHKATAHRPRECGALVAPKPNRPSISDGHGVMHGEGQLSTRCDSQFTHVNLSELSSKALLTR